MEDLNITLLIVVVAAFIAGYAAISLIFRWVKKINERPPLNDEFREDEINREILGIEPGATKEDIKRRYHELVDQYHPDKVAHLGPKLLQAAEDERERINTAYNYFKKKYDLE